MGSMPHAARAAAPRRAAAACSACVRASAHGRERQHECKMKNAKFHAAFTIAAAASIRRQQTAQPTPRGGFEDRGELNGEA